MAFIKSFTNVFFARKPEQLSSTQRKGLVVSYVTALVSFILGIFFTVQGSSQIPAQRFYTLGGSYLFIAVISLITVRVIYSRRMLLAALLVAIPLWVTIITQSTYIAGIGTMMLIITIIHTLLVASIMLEGWQRTLVLVVGVIVSYMAITLNTVEFNWFELVRTNSTATLAVTGVILVALLILLVLILIFRLVDLSLQIKLLVAFLFISSLPLGISHFVNSTASRTAARQQAREVMLNAAQQAASSFDTLIANKIAELDSISQVADLGRLLDTPSGETPSEDLESRTINIMAAVQRQSNPFCLSYAVIATDGRVLADTDPSFIPVKESQRDYFLEPLKTNLPYVSEIEFLTINNATQGVIYISAPVKNSQFKVVGVVRARYNLTMFNEAASRNKNIAQNGSYPILLDDHYLRLADPVNSGNIYKLISPLPEGAYQSLIDARRFPNVPISTMSTDLPLFNQSLALYKAQPVFTGDFLSNATTYIGAAVPMTRRPWLVVYIQKESIFLVPVETSLRNNQLYISLIQVIANILVLIFTSTLVRPISNLTLTAKKIAEGDLNVLAKANSGDEVQTLADSFNSMTGQLRSLVTSLEGRVQERTEDLAKQTERSAFRVVQLQAVADVARTVASVQDLEGVLNSVTQLVTQRFHFYHAGIFLMDEKGEFAVLRSTNSEGGQRMLARQHKLRVGQVGIVGYVASSGKPRVATDVGDDAVFFNNPDLPSTRSEMALPLTSSGKVIGVLDIQSTEANAFSEDDVSLFLTLADQVSVAIMNNQLFEETRRALREAEALHSQYLGEEWTKQTEELGLQGYVYSLTGLKASPYRSNQQIISAIQNGEPCTASGDGPDQDSLAVPIKVRGLVIGVIDLHQAESRIWHEDEIAVVQTIADQIGSALENARLLDQTLRRAERERRALDITKKIREVNDPKTMIQVALTELQKTLKASRAQIIVQTNQPGENGNGYHHDLENQQ